MSISDHLAYLGVIPKDLQIILTGLLCINYIIEKKTFNIMSEHLLVWVFLKRELD